MTAGLQAGVVSQQSTSLKGIAKGELPPDPVTEEMKDMLGKLKNIEAKEKCLRVQFLDWLSDKLLDWSNRVHRVSANIESPCLIEVAPRTREQSKSAKEAKEIARLKELLNKERAFNESLKKGN